jgi:SAM-dependent methyltransferase
MTTLFSQEDIRQTYEPINDHILTRDIIRRYARNARDIREVALEGLDLSGVRQALDLGCSYGFFTEKLEGRLSPGAGILGVDVIDLNNRDRFLQTILGMGYNGDFIQGRADLIRDMDTGRFDLVVASYSLYFFPHLVGEISRILSPKGIFVAVTHSRDSLKEVTRFLPLCMEKVGVAAPLEIAIHRLFGEFSLEDGGPGLSRHFRTVERILYPNRLQFPFEQVGDCVNYLDRKRYLLLKDVSETDPQKLEDMLVYFKNMVYEHAREHGAIDITKDDAVFRCFSPIRRGET